jgi:hypothetical protein
MLFGALGGLGALAARSLGAASPAEAAGAVQLGVGNAETSITSIRNSSGSASAIALVGSSTAAGATGLQGVASGSNGKGVYGSANAGTGAMGVYGAATQGHGVQGYGVIGVVGNGTTWGVYGNTGADTGIGVNATAVGTNGTAVQATGGRFGVRVKAATYVARDRQVTSRLGPGRRLLRGLRRPPVVLPRQHRVGAAGLSCSLLAQLRSALSSLTDPRTICSGGATGLPRARRPTEDDPCLTR